MPDLFALTDLPSWLQVPEVDTETATRVRRYASGWLSSATRLTAWPDPVPDDLWAWGLELAAIAYRNPDGVASEQVDDAAATWDRRRRAEILSAATARYGAAGTPLYSFPEPDWHWEVTATTALPS